MLGAEAGSTVMGGLGGALGARVDATIAVTGASCCPEEEDEAPVGSCVLEDASEWVGGGVCGDSCCPCCCVCCCRYLARASAWYWWMSSIIAL